MNNGKISANRCRCEMVNQISEPWLARESIPPVFTIARRKNEKNEIVDQ
jgi:hypothetical protein